MSATPCHKKGYDSLKGAQQHLAWIKKKSISARKLPNRAYKCPDCGQYHLTSLKNWNEYPKKKKKDRGEWR